MKYRTQAVIMYYSICKQTKTKPEININSLTDMQLLNRINYLLYCNQCLEMTMDEIENMLD